MQGAVVRNLPVWDGQFNLFVIYFKRWEYSAEKHVFFLCIHLKDSVQSMHHDEKRFRETNVANLLLHVFLLLLRSLDFCGCRPTCSVDARGLMCRILDFIFAEISGFLS